MQTHHLICHPAHKPLAISGVAAKVVGLDEHWLRLRWRIEGSQKLVVPPFAGKLRADGLWRTTCFELFLRPGRGRTYLEFNLSPSERWAAYDFSGYREGMAERPMPRAPGCTIREGGNMAIFDAAIPRAGLPDRPCSMGLCAVIDEEGGRLSYWALAHARAMPDFHDPACFAAVLPAASDT